MAVINVGPKRGQAAENGPPAFQAYATAFNWPTCSAVPRAVERPPDAPFLEVELLFEGLQKFAVDRG